MIRIPHMISLTLALIACLPSGSSIGFSAEEEEGLKSYAAGKAQKSYEYKERKLYEIYQQKLKDLRKDYIGDLEDAMKQETKRAELEKALEIKEEITRVNKLIEDAESAQSESKNTNNKKLEEKDLIGKRYTNTHSIHGVFHILFQENGKVRNLTTGKVFNWWIVNGDEYKVNMNFKYLNSVEFSKDLKTAKCLGAYKGVLKDYQLIEEEE